MTDPIHDEDLLGGHETAVSVNPTSALHDLPQGQVPVVPDGNDDVLVDFVPSTADPGLRGAGPAAGFAPMAGPPLQAAQERAGPGTGQFGLFSNMAASAAEQAADQAFAAPPPGKTAFWQLEHYRGLWDVDTADVLKRMFSAVAFRRDFFAEVEAKPDLYGPFWITTTCVFLMAMIANALDYTAHDHAAEDWEGDVAKVGYGASVMYGYVFGAALVLWIWLKVISLAQISLVALWCIYGYSMTIWLPITLIAVIPNSIWLTILCVCASAYSAIFLVLNLKTPVYESLPKSQAVPTLLIIFVAHLGVAVALRWNVFTYEVPVPKMHD